MKNRLYIIILIIFSSTILSGKNLFITDKSISIVKESEVSDYPIGYYPKKQLGVTVENGSTIFRVFSKHAENVELIVFDKAEDKDGSKYNMYKDNSGIWEVKLDGELFGKYYGFLVKQKGAEPVLCLDPYAKAVASYNTYFGQRKGLIINTDYNWEGDKWIKQDWRDLIIYEMHIKDMTAHKSSGATKMGTYQGLIEEGKTGGISYIKNLGVNTVELLPSQEFANIEIPYKQTMRGRLNTWNPYERNYWGYMTAAFFAPESYYTNNILEYDKWCGTDGKAVKDFKDMVKAFHKEGIAVIMDVVYNHISEYEFGNLKEIDKEYYFRLDKAGNYRIESGCGNDFKTESPMARRMIVESILYWMKEYHVDGFRFDLGKLIDWETCEEIIREAKKINPEVVIVCEPWGGGYDPAGFSNRGWGSWNDQIRNGIKGENPTNGLGWIFGRWYGNNNLGRIKSYVNGTLTRDKYGLFQKKEHSVNYLESHDGYTFGDFIRIGLGDKVGANTVTQNVNDEVKLTPLQMKLNKLGALFLFTSQGITMISEGQEYARSKVIPYNVQVEDTNKGKIDANTYNKDNEANYLNYEQAKINSDLLDYYKGLIELRKSYPVFRRTDYKDVKFIDFTDNEFALGYSIKTGDDEFLVLFNSNPGKNQEYTLPSGKWNVLADSKKAGVKVLDTISGKMKIPASTGIVMKKK